MQVAACHFGGKHRRLLPRRPPSPVDINSPSYDRGELGHQEHTTPLWLQRHPFFLVHRRRIHAPQLKNKHTACDALRVHESRACVIQAQVRRIWPPPAQGLLQHAPHCTAPRAARDAYSYTQYFVRAAAQSAAFIGCVLRSSSNVRRAYRRMFSWSAPPHAPVSCVRTSAKSSSSISTRVPRAASAFATFRQAECASGVAADSANSLVWLSPPTLVGMAGGARA